MPSTSSATDVIGRWAVDRHGRIARIVEEHNTKTITPHGAILVRWYHGDAVDGELWAVNHENLLLLADRDIYLLQQACRIIPPPQN